MMKKLIPLALFLTASNLPAAALAEQQGEEVILLELFTSQGCYSCPPADDLLRTTYRDQPGLLPLEFHVDYWDDLIYGFSGSWQDPFSSAVYTDRQRAYNKKIRDTASMYTPQLIIHGRRETVGSHQGKIDNHLAAVQQESPNTLKFVFNGSADAGWQANAKGTLQGNEDIYYVIYIKEHTTNVKAGENKGKEMINSHIVRELKRNNDSRQISIPPYDAASEGCAVWMQKPYTGAVIAAAKCPG